MVPENPRFLFAWFAATLLAVLPTIAMGQSPDETDAGGSSPTVEDTTATAEEAPVILSAETPLARESEEDEGDGEEEDEEEGPEDLSLAETTSRPDPDLASGARLYGQKCAVCHGASGDGDGPAARQIDPRPRDFIEAAYRLRSTESGSLPTDDDLYRTIGRGMRGTAMPPFGGLSATDRWQLVFFLKSLSPRFEEERDDPGEVIEVPLAPPRTMVLVERGQKVFDAAQCGQCHGPDGRGDGAAAATMVDSKGRPIAAFDMSRGWKLKGGSSPRDIYRTVHTGLDGTPMPTYHDTLSERDTWALVYFVESLFLDRE